MCTTITNWILNGVIVGECMKFNQELALNFLIKKAKRYYTK